MNGMRKQCCQTLLYQLKYFCVIFQPLNSKIEPEDISWVGAWWVGVLVGGGVLLFSVVPMLAFPSIFPGTADIRKQKKLQQQQEQQPQHQQQEHTQPQLQHSGQNDDSVEDDVKEEEDFKSVVSALKKLLTNRSGVFYHL